jgi:hypothetical protein
MCRKISNLAKQSVGAPRHRPKDCRENLGYGERRSPYNRLIELVTVKFLKLQE